MNPSDHEHDKHDDQDELDALLRDGLVESPPYFSAGLMARIEREEAASKTTPPTVPVPTKLARWLPGLQWLAWAGAAAIGLDQLLAFIFGIWAVAPAL